VCNMKGLNRAPNRRKEKAQEGKKGGPIKTESRGL
jgi:hypothetical protein